MYDRHFQATCGHHAIKSQPYIVAGLQNTRPDYKCKRTVRCLKNHKRSMLRGNLNPRHDRHKTSDKENKRERQIQEPARFESGPQGAI